MAGPEVQAVRRGTEQESANKKMEKCCLCGVFFFFSSARIQNTHQNVLKLAWQLGCLELSSEILLIHLPSLR